MVKINKHIILEKIMNIKQFIVDKNNSDIPSEYYDYDLQGILIDAYGRNERAYIGSSAYMLIYQKRNKKPVIINAKELDDKINKILEEKKRKNQKTPNQTMGIYIIYMKMEKMQLKKMMILIISRIKKIK